MLSKKLKLLKIFKGFYIIKFSFPEFYSLKLIDANLPFTNSSIKGSNFKMSFEIILKKMKNKIVIALTALFLIACSNANRKEYANDAKSTAQMDSANVKAPLSSIAAKEKVSDSNRKFIRTAEMKFQVKNVIKSTYSIEDVVGKYNGFVTYTNLTSNVDRQTEIPVSNDSSLESTYFNVNNTMTIRIPNNKLDTALKAIATWVDYMDYRIIKADDVSLQILSNRLAQKRNNKLQDRIVKDIDHHGKKLHESTDAEENASNKEEQSDNALLSNLTLADQVKYSTVSLTIYQKQEVKKILVANEKNIKSFEPGFGPKVLEALKFGWDAFEEILLFFIKIWWLILTGLTAYFVYKKFRFNFK